MVGKLQQYEKTPGIVAYQLLVIEDVRTSKICRRLLTQSGRGMIIPVDHQFWKKYGFGPYHMNCRTSIRAIFKNQISKNRIVTDNPSMKNLAEFKPQKGFGGNPLDNGNWWMMTPSQMEQAIRFGILGQFNREENVFADYDSVWKGYKRYEGKNGGWYDLTENLPNDWEGTDFPNKPIVEFLAQNGYKIKVIPSIERVKDKYGIKWSNPDILINGKLADIKTVDTSIASRLKKAKVQKVRNAVLYIPDRFSESDIEEVFNDWSHGTLNVLYIYKGEIKTKNLK